MRESDFSCTQREEELRRADARFQDGEREYSREWEKRRLELAAERDVKVIAQA